MAVEECIEEGILKDFLLMHRREVADMCLTEFDEIKYGELIREEGRREGIQEGRREGIQEGRREGIQEGRREGIQEGRREGIQEGRREGRREGIQAGEGRMAELMIKLFSTGRERDAFRAKEDKGYREELFREFGL